MYLSYGLCVCVCVCVHNGLDPFVSVDVYLLLRCPTGPFLSAGALHVIRRSPLFSAACMPFTHPGLMALFTLTAFLSPLFRFFFFFSYSLRNVKLNLIFSFNQGGSIKEPQHDAQSDPLRRGT